MQCVYAFVHMSGYADETHRAAQIAHGNVVVFTREFMCQVAAGSEVNCPSNGNPWPERVRRGAILFCHALEGTLAVVHATLAVALHLQLVDEATHFSHTLCARGLGHGLRPTQAEGM